MMSDKNLSELENKIVFALHNSLRETINENTTLQDMLKSVSHDTDETSHNSQFRWEGIDDAFKLKVAGNPFEDAITSAFFQTHTYKYLDHPTFNLSFERELRQRAVPTQEIESAMSKLSELITDLDKNPGELDSGWNHQIEDLMDVTTFADSRDASYTEPFSGGGLYPEGDTYDKGDLEGF